jgi:hypothetical protein
MLDHVIAFRADLTPDGEDELFAKLRVLATIPGVLGFAVGKNHGERSRGFDYCMRITFADRDALARYEEHPTHVEIRAYNRAHTIEHICVDFDWDEVPTGA